MTYRLSVIRAFVLWPCLAGLFACNNCEKLVEQDVQGPRARRLHLLEGPWWRRKADPWWFLGQPNVRYDGGRRGLFTALERSAGHDQRVPFRRRGEGQGQIATPRLHARDAFR